jgi:propanol-preferring alcohol dehydrogenase
VLESLDYARHLWMEREIKSVANVTRADVREMLADAAAMQLKPSVEEMLLSDANVALGRVARGEGVRGALVLDVGNR